MYHELSAAIVLGLFLVTSDVSASDPVEIADRLAAHGDYDAAITEYKRCLFLDPASPEKASIHRRMAICYRDLGRWDEAIGWFQHASRNAVNDSAAAEDRINVALIHLRNGNYGAAEVILLRVFAFAKPQFVRQRASLFLVVCYTRCHKWRQALDLFTERLYTVDTLRNARLRALLEKAGSMNRKSPGTAKWLSTIVPGLGQAYAGRPLAALNSLIVNVAAGFLFTDRIAAGADILEGVSFATLFLRYWAGGRARAGRFADEWNTRRDRQLEEQVLNELEAAFESLTPTQSP